MHFFILPCLRINRVSHVLHIASSLKNSDELVMKVKNINYLVPKNLEWGFQFSYLANKDNILLLKNQFRKMKFGAYCITDYTSLKTRSFEKKESVNVCSLCLCPDL